MFFKRSRTPQAQPPVAPHDPGALEADNARLLDALGEVFAAYIHGCFDLPQRSAEDARRSLDQWRRHALLGTRVTEAQAPGELALHSESADGLPLRDRNWRAVTGAFGDHRRAERVFVERAMADLRDTIWLCIERAHETLSADDTATRESAVQLDRVRGALSRLETGVVKTEITQAMEALQQITATRQTAQQSLYRDLTNRVESLGQQLDDARKQGETDALTGLGNRLAFDRAVSRQVALHAINGSPLSALMIDLDNLKSINDTLGHAAGDEALLGLANALHRVFLGDGDQLCRLGGDEFAVILPNSAGHVAERLADRLATVLSNEPWPYAESGLPLTASVGVAEWQRGETPSAWLSRADAAMYAMKQARRRAA